MDTLLKLTFKNLLTLKIFYFQILLPACFVCLAMLLTLILPALEMEKPLEMHPWNYPTWGTISLFCF